MGPKDGDPTNGTQRRGPNRGGNPRASDGLCPADLHLVLEQAEGARALVSGDSSWVIRFMPSWPPCTPGKR